MNRPTIRPGQLTLRNERKIGEFFLNKLSQRPLGDRDNRVINYLGIHYDQPAARISHGS